MQIIPLAPFVKEVVWGGQWLVEQLGRPGRANTRLGESWEAYAGSVVTAGEFAGRTLGELFAEQGAALFGSAAARYPRFPLLVKFIDATENLSVQVHPDDALAQQLENYPYGKTEFWYVLEAAQNAEIIYGLNAPDITHGQLQEALQTGGLLRYCHRAPVQAGDVVFIPAGTVHALTAGVVVYELQQDCDITYRLYDWGRTNREIHLEKGLRAIKPEYYQPEVTQPVKISSPPEQSGFTSALLAECPYFRSELLTVSQSTEQTSRPDSFTLLTVLAGSGTLTAGEAHFTLKRGDTLLIAAGTDTFLLTPDTGTSLTLISSWLPSAS